MYSVKAEERKGTNASCMITVVKHLDIKTATSTAGLVCRCCGREAAGLFSGWPRLHPGLRIREKVEKALQCNSGGSILNCFLPLGESKMMMPVAALTLSEAEHLGCLKLKKAVRRGTKSR